MKANERLVQLLVFHGSNPNQSSFMRTIRFRPRPVYRMFDSITGDQKVPVFIDGNLNYMKMEDVEEYSDKELEVPSFDKETHEMEIKPVTQFHKHKVDKDIYRVKTRYGKEIKVTGDHSIFAWEFDRDVDSPSEDPNGKLKKKESRKLTEDDYIAIPAKLPIKEKDVDEIDVLDFIDFDDEEIYIYNSKIPTLIKKETLKRGEGHTNLWTLDGKPFIEIRENYWTRNRLANNCKKFGRLPLSIIKSEDLDLEYSKISLKYNKNKIPNTIEVDGDLLWLIGFYFAEGHSSKEELGFCSEERNLEEARRILLDKFGISMTTKELDGVRDETKAICCYSNILSNFFKNIEKNKDWLLQLPNKKLKHLIGGFWCGDGHHNGDVKYFRLYQEDEDLADWLELVLLKFGIVPSKSRYKNEGSFKGGSKITKLSASVNLDFETWDKDAKQRRQAIEFGDLLIVPIREIEKLDTDEEWVYDFAVKDNENFVAGGISCHNSREEVKNLKQISKSPFLECYNEPRDLENEENEYEVI